MLSLFQPKAKLVDRLGNGAEMLLCDGLCQVKHLLADFSTRKDQHHQHLATVGADQLKMLEDSAFQGEVR